MYPYYLFKQGGEEGGCLFDIMASRVGAFLGRVGCAWTFFREITVCANV